MECGSTSILYERMSGDNVQSRGTRKTHDAMRDSSLLAGLAERGGEAFRFRTMARSLMTDATWLRAFLMGNSFALAVLVKNILWSACGA